MNTKELSELADYLELPHTGEYATLDPFKLIQAARQLRRMAELVEEKDAWCHSYTQHELERFKNAHKTIQWLRRILTSIAYGPSGTARISARLALEKLDKRMKKWRK